MWVSVLNRRVVIGMVILVELSPQRPPSLCHHCARYPRKEVLDSEAIAGSPFRGVLSDDTLLPYFVDGCNSRHNSYPQPQRGFREDELQSPVQPSSRKNMIASVRARQTPVGVKDDPLTESRRKTAKTGQH